MMTEPNHLATRRPTLTRVLVKNYRSIAAARVELGRLTFLVGPNGSGKSNFLDSLRFTCDALRTSLDHALRERGGIAEVRRRSAGHPTHFGIRCEFDLASGSGHYAFRVSARSQGGFEIQTEECAVHGQRSAWFLVRDGEVQDARIAGAPPDIALPAALRDRLYLVSASALAEFRPVYDALSSMGFYNPNPDRIRDLQSPDSGDLLYRDGANLTSVLRQLASRDPGRKQSMERYLACVAAGLRGVDVKPVSPKETLEFTQEVPGATEPWRFPAGNMSDGTLRALGILVALFQSRNPAPDAPLVGIEEPEMALHPAAAAALLDALREAAESVQVIATTQSPDLIDRAAMSDELLLAVHAENGETRISAVDPSGRDLLRRGLYAPAELPRLDQPQPEISLFDEGKGRLPLFDQSES